MNKIKFFLLFTSLMLIISCGKQNTKSTKENKEIIKEISKEKKQ